MDNIEIKILEDKASNWRCLLEPWLHFFTNEPMNTAVEAFKTAEGKKSLEALLYDVVNFDDTPCIVAWDTEKDKAAGFIVNATLYKDPTPHQARPPIPFLNHQWEENSLKRIGGIGMFLQSLFIRSDVFNKYGVDKVWKLQIASVTPEYTKRGLACRMSEKCIQVAKELGYKLMLTEFTSAYTQRVGAKLKFESVFDVDYENNYPNYVHLPAEVKDVHKIVSVMVRHL